MRTGSMADPYYNEKRVIEMQYLLEWGKIIGPVLIALIGIIPTIKSNAKKTNQGVDNLSKRMDVMEKKLDDSTQEVSKLSGRMDELEKKMDESTKKSEWGNAKQTRIRILRFYDEICEGKQHSENHYEEVLDDIDSYEKFCDAHKDYHNNKGQIAMKNIRISYEKHKTANDFLKACE